MNLTSSKNWKTVKLGDIADINKRTIMSKYPHRYIEYIDVASVSDRRVQETQKLELKDAPSRAKRIVIENDILISTVRPNLKHYCFIKSTNDKQVASTGFAVISATKANPLFLYYFLTCDKITDYLSKIAEGHTSAYPSFNPSVLEKLELTIPLIDEQKEIAEMLGSLDDKIELLRKENKTLENIAQTLFKEWFVDFNFPGSTGKMIDSELGEIPEGWKVYELREVFEFIKGKKPPEVSEINKDNFLPQILIDNLDGGKTIFAKNEKVILCNDSNLLMVMDGASSGRIEFGYSGIVGSTLSKLEFKKPVKAIIYFFLKSLEKNIRENTTGSAIPHTDKGKVYGFRIALPELKLETEEVFESFMQKMILNRRETQVLSKLRDELLNKIFN